VSLQMSINIEMRFHCGHQFRLKRASYRNNAQHAGPRTKDSFASTLKHILMK
jgi:hypothetical protein